MAHRADVPDPVTTLTTLSWALVGLVVMAAPPLAATTVSERCSLSPAPPVRERGQPFYLLRGLPETRVAGPGTVEDRSTWGRWAGQAAGIKGQLAEVVRVGGDGVPPAVLAAPRVILVPWGYAPDCMPAPWEGDDIWLAPGELVFVSAILRDPAHWADNVPTFDVIYPQNRVQSGIDESLQGLVNLERHTTPAERFATPAELFNLYEKLPSIEDVAAGGWPVLDALRHWAATDSLAQTRQVLELLHSYQSCADRHAASTMRFPMLGSYRMTVTYPDGVEKVFFLRTAPRAWNASSPSMYHGYSSRPWNFAPKATGADLMFWLADRHEVLPDTSDWQPRASWGWSVSFTPSMTGADTVWRGELESREFEKYPRDDAYVDALFGDGSSPPPNDHRVKGFAGFFTRTANGSWEFTQDAHLSDKAYLRIRGVRIDDRTVTLAD